MKPLFWVASSKKDLLKMPDQVIDLVGYALYLAQRGLKHSHAKALKGSKTPTHDMDVIEARLKLARLHSEGADQ